MKATKFILAFLLLTFCGINVFAGIFSPNSSHYLRSTSSGFQLFDLENRKMIWNQDLAQTMSIKKPRPLALSHNASFLLLSGNRMKVKTQQGQTFFIIDLKRNSLVREFPLPNNRPGYSKPAFEALNGTQEYILYGRENENSMNAVLQRFSFQGESWEPLSSTLLKCETNKEYRLPSPYLGKLFVHENGKSVAIARYRGIFKYDLQNLGNKPTKLKLPSSDAIYAMSPDLTAVYGNFSNTGANYCVFSTQISLPKKQNIGYGEPIFINSEKATVIYGQKRKPGLLHYDYQNGTKLLEVGNMNRYEISPNGKILIAGSVFDATNGQLIGPLIDNYELIRNAKNALKESDTVGAIAFLEEIKPENRKGEVYDAVAFPSYFKVGNHEMAAKAAIDWGKKLPIEDIWDAAYAMTKSRHFTEAEALVSKIQKTDLRLSYPLLLGKFVDTELASSANFGAILDATKKVDNFKVEAGIPPQELFDAGVGLHELYMFKGYAILAEYKTRGLKKALAEANKSFSSALKYAHEPANQSKTTFAMGNAYLKTGNSLDAVDWYEKGITADPNTPDKAWVDCAAAYIDIKNILEDELRATPRARWSKAFLKDYKLVNSRARELCTAYIKADSLDPFAPYIRAMTWLRIDYSGSKKNRINDARLAKKNFIAQQLEVPENCTLMADKNWEGPQVIQKETASTNNNNPQPNSQKCKTICKRCSGMGTRTTSKQCTRCHGSGKAGTCYRCNGQGRTYDSNRQNQSPCYQCRATGKLDCPSCMASGQQSNFGNCDNCDGSGYDCK